jgi:hypothetical protein
MHETIFLTITKWWCNSLDLCFEIITRPWKPEELHYRRMICTIFGIDWKLPQSFSEIKQDEIPQTFKGLRESLHSHTRGWLNGSFIDHHLTPAWPNGSVEYLEETFSFIMSRITRDKTTWQAFRLMNEVGDKHVPRRHLAAKLGVDKELLYRNIARLERQLRSIESTSLLAPFARRDRSAPLEQIIQNWRENKRMLAWELAGENIPYAIASRMVEDLELSVRCYNILKNAGVQTIGDLVRKSEAELRRHGMGNKSMLELKEVLHALDPKLGEMFMPQLNHLISE